MKGLFFGGARNTGKTESIYRLTKYLEETKAYSVIAGRTYITLHEFQCILKKDHKKILIHSYSDDIRSINNFAKFYKENAPVDILIIAIRDESDNLRNQLFKTIGVLDFKLEIPLGKVKRGESRELSIEWYLNEIEQISKHIIESKPFNV